MTYISVPLSLTALYYFSCPKYHSEMVLSGGIRYLLNQTICNKSVLHYTSKNTIKMLKLLIYTLIRTTRDTWNTRIDHCGKSEHRMKRAVSRNFVLATHMETLYHVVLIFNKPLSTILNGQETEVLGS